MLKSNALLTAIQKDHSSLTMDSFTLTDQEKQLLSKEKQHFKYLIKMAKRFCLSSWKEKTFSAIQIALNEKNRGIIKKIRLAFTMQIVATFSL